MITLKNPLRSLLALAALAAGITLSAEPAVKLLAVDMSKALDSYYKSADFSAKLNADAQKVQEQLNTYTKQIEGLGEQVKELMEQSRNTILTVENRARAEQDAQKKLQEYQQLQNEAQNYSVTNQRNLQQRLGNARENFSKEITAVVTKIANARGVTLVLDMNGRSIIGVPVVVYADAGFDITEDVIKEINKDRPTPPPAAAATPAAAPAAPPPAAPAQFTVPNVTPKKP